jgi:hypothetical protein
MIGQAWRDIRTSPWRISVTTLLIANLLFLVLLSSQRTEIFNEERERSQVLERKMDAIISRTPDPGLPPCPVGVTVDLFPPFRKMGPGSMAFIAALSSMNGSADSPSEPNQSAIAVCENDRLLGPAHSIHKEISEAGRGRFSHWKDIGLIFSASDNSDPNINRRSYYAVAPAGK